MRTMTDVRTAPMADSTAGSGLSMASLRVKVEADELRLDGSAACRSTATGISANDWTPEYEEDRMPRHLRAICDSCPLWEACLVAALRMDDIGYRASMTTRQRRERFPELIAAARPSARSVSVPIRRGGSDRDRTPTHAKGAGSLNTYRRGCRCDECRGHNAAARRRERARAAAS
ncbi:Uncharacterised protein [Dermatophilus congolensis]|uniref:4Fe-4S Wbl-type domain-containing protein n=2 Tax=Dermatophilus congolensis TaxID=1863 RepID=A0A239V3T0_9MICO|nr:Uncharacterised protein [Dermatophilus congolensis]STD12769.1 Uncharacterised protein [Dermatophilus congolensis]